MSDEASQRWVDAQRPAGLDVKHAFRIAAVDVSIGRIGLCLCACGSGCGRAQFRCACRQLRAGWPLSDRASQFRASQFRRSARHRGGPDGAGILLAGLFRILRFRSEEARDRWTEPESQRLREVWLHRQWRLTHVPMRRARPSLPAKRSNPKYRRLESMDCFAARSDDSSRSEPAVIMSDRSRSRHTGARSSAF